VVATGSSTSRSSRTLASVGHIIARWMPSSFISSILASGSKKAGGALIERGGACNGLSPGLVTESGFWSLYLSSSAPGGATTLKVGLGM
jgi:hypothetical protein